MNNQSVTRDERTAAVENTSYRFAYLVMSFGLLVCISYRGFALQQSSWDLLALVILGGVTATIYQGTNKVLSRRWGIAAVASLVIAGLLAIVFVLIFR
jgi:1,4-dihydroxy-2-naphthoate octaprenyltransferase